MKVLFVFDIALNEPGPSVHLLNDVLKETKLRNIEYDVISRDMLGIYAKKKGFVYRYFEEINYSFKCFKEYKGKKYDAVFLQSNTVPLFYLIGLRTLHCPIVFNVQDIFPYNLKYSNQLPFSKITFPVFRFLQLIAYKSVSKIITISDDMKDTLVKDGVPEDNVEVIYNWSYGDSLLESNDISNENTLDYIVKKDAFNVLYAGNIGRMQNVEVIVEAANLTKENGTINYYIIGGGANRDNIENMAAGLDNVILLPMQPSNFAESIYSQADLIIIPLAKGGIYTALPSKTSTCFRTNKQMIFCIDSDSKFSKMVSDIDGINVVDCSDSKSLAEKIVEASKSAASLDEEKVSKLFFTYFSRKNAGKYVDVIAGKN